jgi:hypothetical protein
MGSATVNRFYRIAFPTEQSFWQWTERVVEFAGLVRDLAASRSEWRAVIFVPHWPEPGSPIRAYASAGALGVAMRLSHGALIDRSTVVSADELPSGLTMLLGDEGDEADYEMRHAWQQCARTGIC